MQVNTTEAVLEVLKGGKKTVFCKSYNISVLFKFSVLKLEVPEDSICFVATFSSLTYDQFASHRKSFFVEAIENKNTVKNGRSKF